MLYVDDADVHGEQARVSGATIADAPSTHDDGAERWTDRSDRATKAVKNIQHLKASAVRQTSSCRPSVE